MYKLQTGPGGFDGLHGLLYLRDFVHGASLRPLERVENTPEYDRVLACAYFAALQQRYIDDCMHYLTDPDVFDTKTALYEDRTAPGDDQDGGDNDGGDNDGIYPRSSIGPRGEVILEPCALECVSQPSNEGGLPRLHDHTPERAHYYGRARQAQ